MRSLSRRAVLRGAAGVGLSLPWLESWPHRSAHAAPGDFAKRCVLLFTPNGTVPGAWTPSADPTSSQILGPLADHASDILVVSGLDMASSGDDKKGHNRGVGTLWTGLEPNGGNDGDDGYASGISVDQRIAQNQAASTPYNSLELGVQVRSDLPRGRMIYTGANAPIAPEDSPFAVFDRIFGQGVGDPAEVAARLARRQSVLDLVRADAESLVPKLGTVDRIKLEAHLDAVRELEERLAQLGGNGCEEPMMPANFDWKHDNDRYPDVGALQMELMVMALACGLTNVASLMWNGALGSAIFTWLGGSVDHHTLSHDEGEGAQAQLVDINRWYAERFAELLARMKAVPEGDATLLDHSVVVWGSDLGKGQPHYCKKIPFVVAGSCHGYFGTGRHVAYAGGSHNDLLLSVLEAMDVPQATFGDPAFCNGPLAELRA